MATTVALVIVASILVVVFIVARFVGRQEDNPSVSHDQDIVIGDTSRVLDAESDEAAPAIHTVAVEVPEQDEAHDDPVDHDQDEDQATPREQDAPILELVQPPAPKRASVPLKQSQQVELVLETVPEVESSVVPPDFESRLYGQPLQAANKVDALESADIPEHLLLVYVIADSKKPFAGPDIVKACQAQGLRHGERSIFHQTHQGQIQFSVASAVEPGIFNLAVIALMHTPGLSFFVDMRKVDAPRRAFRLMLEVAHEVAYQLGGDILTDQRQSLTPLSVGQYLARIKAFNASRNHAPTPERAEA